MDNSTPKAQKKPEPAAVFNESPTVQSRSERAIQDDLEDIKRQVREEMKDVYREIWSRLETHLRLLHNGFPLPLEAPANASAHPSTRNTSESSLSISTRTYDPDLEDACTWSDDSEAADSTTSIAGTTTDPRIQGKDGEEAHGGGDQGTGLWVPPAEPHPLRPHKRYHAAPLKVKKEHTQAVLNSVQYALTALGMPPSTVNDWLHRLQAEPDWLPNGRHFATSAMSLTVEEEGSLIAEINTYYLNPKQLLNSRLERIIILNFVKPLRERQIQENKERAILYAQDPKKKNAPKRMKLVRFECSNKFLIRFNKRARFSLRVFTKARREAVKQEDVDNFLLRLSNIRSAHPTAFVVNMDETAWFLAMDPKRTLAPTGSPEVVVETDLNPKANFTSIGTVAADGTRLPLCIIARGKTDVCHKQFREGGKKERRKELCLPLMVS